MTIESSPLVRAVKHRDYVGHHATMYNMPISSGHVLLPEGEQHSRGTFKNPVIPKVIARRAHKTSLSGMAMSDADGAHGELLC